MIDVVLTGRCAGRQPSRLQRPAPQDEPYSVTADWEYFVDSFWTRSDAEQSLCWSNDLAVFRPFIWIVNQWNRPVMVNSSVG
ncbi:hypothetical protein [Amycolatopsis sp. WAC 04169]|uniref:hypothetical protein n=1 Tax=Amycolatopsis sp. WAC 04169 TaxID=2203197 RepID=UPI000F78D268|nr:hypothetical protein [Amycolatopsis sp. WAC 04169]